MEEPALEKSAYRPDLTEASEISLEARTELKELDARINALLPPRYQGCYQEVNPHSMGSAKLKYSSDGKVAWDDVWTSFCDLALAGGPPHRGTLLGPVSAEEARANPALYRTVVEEIGRGLWLTTHLPILPLLAPGWVGVRCRDVAMAGWLVRAIVAENVSARQDGDMLLLPAGPHFQLAREIKNVVTALAKTCHYWTDHLSVEQRETVARGIPLLEPALPTEVRAAPSEYQAVMRQMERDIERATGLPAAPTGNPGWVGAACPGETMTVWLLRAVVVGDVLCRREESVLCLPVGLGADSREKNRRVVETVARARRLWDVQRLLADGEREGKG